MVGDHVIAIDNTIITQMEQNQIEYEIKDFMEQRTDSPRSMTV